jgi:hypothetical protein
MALGFNTPPLSIARAGVGWGTMLSTYVADLDLYVHDGPRSINVLMMNGGQGDFIQDAQDAETCYERAVAYAAAAREAGYDYIIHGTHPDIGPLLGTPTQIDTLYEFNDLLTANADGAFDVIAECNSGVLSDATNLTYFDIDQVHLRAPGASALGLRYATAYGELPIAA